MKSTHIAGVTAASVAVGWCLRDLWARTAARREAEEMRLRSEREAAISAKLADDATADGDAFVECSHGIDRLFGMRQSDTALVLIDMQADFLHHRGRLGQHYDSSRHKVLANTITKVEKLLTAARRAGLTVAHSRSHRYGAAIRRDLLLGPQAGAPAIDAAANARHPQHFGAVDLGYELLPSLRALPGEVRACMSCSDPIASSSPPRPVHTLVVPTRSCVSRFAQIVVDKWTFGAFASTDLEAQLRARGIRKILLAGILTNVCVFATAVQACDRFFRVCLVEDATGAFSPAWHEQAVDLLSGPQCAPGHASKAVGLYFGEVATVGDVEVALGKL